MSKTALVTGASSGIGEAIADVLAARGYDLVLVARRKDKLEELANRLQSKFGVKTRVCPADLAVDDAAGELASLLNRENLSIDMLVNNAGVMYHGPFVDMSDAEIDKLIALNITGMTRIVRAFLPDMVARSSGQIMNVASISAFWPIPNLAVYAASKSFVLSLTESLSEEYRQSGVTFTAVCPSTTATPMVEAVQQQDTVSVPNLMIGAVEDVARDAVDACEKGQVVLVPGVANRMVVELTRHQPKWLLRSAIGMVTRLARK